MFVPLVDRVMGSLENGSIDIPPSKVLPDTNITLPYVILGDEAYPLMSYLMRPFPHQDLNEGKNSNYGLSRATIALNILLESFMQSGGF